MELKCSKKDGQTDGKTTEMVDMCLDWKGLAPFKLLQLIYSAAIQRLMLYISSDK